jgi:hypothetical protein
MKYSEFLNLHPLERAAMAEFAVALESDRREFLGDIAEAIAKSLSG